eukprot:GHVS01078360.1.p1 GENE.GHVS01078360.1~~GHVS01078360.1.p1  ORF type:complete len:117 (+),score=0.32 GHVS01078360.1:163-513(+)
MSSTRALLLGGLDWPNVPWLVHSAHHLEGLLPVPDAEGNPFKTFLKSSGPLSSQDRRRRLRGEVALLHDLGPHPRALLSSSSRSNACYCVPKQEGISRSYLTTTSCVGFRAVAHST